MSKHFTGSRGALRRPRAGRMLQQSKHRNLDARGRTTCPPKRRARRRAPRSPAACYARARLSAARCRHSAAAEAGRAARAWLRHAADRRRRLYARAADGRAEGRARVRRRPSRSRELRAVLLRLRQRRPQEQRRLLRQRARSRGPRHRVGTARRVVRCVHRHRRRFDEDEELGRIGDGHPQEGAGRLPPALPSSETPTPAPLQGK